MRIGLEQDQIQIPGKKKKKKKKRSGIRLSSPIRLMLDPAWKAVNELGRAHNPKSGNQEPFM
jgi:hypothetical protein